MNEQDHGFIKKIPQSVFDRVNTLRKKAEYNKKEEWVI